MNNVDVVYTPWHNLKKTASMDVGQVGFHNPKIVSHMVHLRLQDCNFFLVVPQFKSFLLYGSESLHVAVV